jgi:GNAT superfamily N-acetyltransferase
MDMLVSLYALDEPARRVQKVSASGITVRRPRAHERAIVAEWVRRIFGDSAPGWASECAVALSSVPATCFIATRDSAIVGFACYDATAKGFFGPTGTSRDARGQGIGAALLVACLSAMWEAGYAYAVIGGVGADAKTFYEKVVGAVEIAGSTPGVYSDPITH